MLIYDGSKNKYKMEKLVNKNIHKVYGKEFNDNDKNINFSKRKRIKNLKKEILEQNLKIYEMHEKIKGVKSLLKILKI